MKNYEENIKLQKEYEIDINKDTLSTFFRKKGTLLQDQQGEGTGKLYPQKYVAELLEISVDQLRQKIYGKKPLTRDWLIAICAAYGLSEEETNEALWIAQMPTFDSRATREEALADYLENHKGNPSSIKSINNHLKKKRLPLLDISKRNKSKDKQDEIKPKYHEYKKRIIRTFGIDGYPFNSLSMQYLPTSRCLGKAFLENSLKERFILEVESNGNVHVIDSSYNIKTVSEADLDQYQPYAEELRQLTTSEKQRLDDILNDTRNYKNRYSANIIGSKLHVFYEEFNYYEPMKNEYFFMEYFDGRYSLSIANKSLFMKAYLSSDDYSSLYHDDDRKRIRTYSTVKEIDDLISDKTISLLDKDVLKKRKKTYERLQKNVDGIVQKIKNKTLKIRDVTDVIDTPDEIFAFYNATSLFDFQSHEENGVEIMNSKDCIEYITNGGISVTITCNDLEVGFELGLNTIEQIAALKIQVGDLESVLQ